MSPALPLLLHLGSLCALPALLADPPAPPVVPPLRISIAVAEQDGAPVQTPDWLSEQLAEVRRLYNDFGIYFHDTETRTLDARFANLETRADRDALASELKKGVLNVFIVASLRDVHEEERFRMGVHWAPNGDLRRQYVIVSAAARKTTMAHEIGHYFKLQHTFVPDNLMSYERTGADVFLTAAQRTKVIASARSYVSRKELVP